eukprot:Skav201376  [mRNA]  locus=scaffold3514:21629:24464:- [translate_table: standard]
MPIPGSCKEITRVAMAALPLAESGAPSPSVPKSAWPQVGLLSELYEKCLGVKSPTGVGDDAHGWSLDPVHVAGTALRIPPQIPK